MLNPTVRPWRCFAVCWSCGGEVEPKGATRSEAERPLHWFCRACEVRWVAYADRVEVPAWVKARAQTAPREGAPSGRPAPPA